MTPTITPEALERAIKAARIAHYEKTGACGPVIADAIRAGILAALPALQAAPAAAGVPHCWTKCKPTVEGAYYVRGFNLMVPREQQYEALVQVRAHKFAGEEAPALVCNLHESTSDDNPEDWHRLCEMSDRFEWLGPLQAAQPAAQPQAEQRSEIRITDEKGRPMTYWGGKAAPAEQQGADALVDSLVQVMIAKYDGLGHLPPDVLGVLNMAVEALAAPPAPAAVPDGFVLVPRTPTDSMVGAGCMELAGSLGGYESGQVYMCWAAMLAAAPAPEVF